MTRYADPVAELARRWGVTVAEIENMPTEALLRRYHEIRADTAILDAVNAVGGEQG